MKSRFHLKESKDGGMVTTFHLKHKLPKALCTSTDRPTFNVGIAFFVLAIYRFIYEDGHANLETFPQ